MTTSRPGSARRILIFPDAHIPFHDDAALSCLLQTADLWKPHEVVCLGDLLDAAAFSSHPAISLAEKAAHSFIDHEVAPANRLLDRLQGPGRKRKLVYIEGNHEYRVERFATSVQAALGRDMYKLFSPRRLIGQRVDETGNSQGERKNFKWIPYIKQSGVYSHYKVTKDLIAVHGWSIARHAAMQHMALAKNYSIVFGHVHRFQHVMSRDPLSDKVHHAWSPGCLSELAPIYMANNPGDWVHGFTMLYVGTDSWTPYTVHIDRGHCVLPDGTQVRAEKGWRLLDGPRPRRPKL